ncbi:MAG: hypothetical protein ACUVUG_09235 [Candidatus Aminicenantia bacterium]
MEDKRDTRLVLTAVSATARTVRDKAREDSFRTNPEIIRFIGYSLD